MTSNTNRPSTSSLSKYQYGGSYSFGRHVSAHVAVAEKALGKKLPLGSVVHHWDGDGRNSANENLLVCPSESYHKLIHRRMRAYDACGNANWQHCQFCETWGPPESMQAVRKGERPAITYYHAACRSAYRKGFKQRTGVKI